jgi:hypothetical protein
MERDNLNKRINSRTDREGVRHDSDTTNWLWPILGIGVLLLAGLLFFGNMGDRPNNTQVGQNVERPTTPKTTPTTPATTPKQQ